MRFTLRALLAVALLVGVYVVGAGLVVGLVVLVIELIAWGAPGFAIGKVAVFAAVAAFGIARALLARRSGTGEEEVPGTAVRPEDQPALWDLVRELATAAGTRAPDEIRLVPEVNAAVAEESSWLGLRPGTRRMYLGLPLLVGLDAAQLRSVLAHELGHYSGRHTALGPVTYRGKEAIARVITRFEGRGLVAGIFRGYARLYWAVAHGVSRQQELEADRISAEAAGPGTAISALRELAPLEVAWSAYVEQYVSAGSSLDRRPKALTRGFARFLEDPARRERLDAVRREPATEPTSRYDTHPAIDVRVAALAALPGVTTHVPGRPALDLVSDADRLLEAAEAACFAPGTPSASYDDLVPEATAHRLREGAAVADRAAEALGLPADLGGVLAALHDGRARELAAAVTTGNDGVLADAATRLTSSAMAAHLLEHGAARVALSWSDVWDLVAPDGTVLDPVPLAEAAVADPTAVAAAVAWLSAAGAPVELSADREVASPATPRPPTGGPGGPGELVAALAPVISGGPRLLVVLEGGIAVARLPFRARLAVVGPGGRRAMLRRAVSQGADAILGDPRTRFVAWEAVREARLTGRRLGGSVLLVRAADGVELRIRSTSETEVVGSPWAVLRGTLGEAFVVEGDVASSSHA